MPRIVGRPPQMAGLTVMRDADRARGAAREALRAAHGERRPHRVHAHLFVRRPAVAGERTRHRLRHVFVGSASGLDNVEPRGERALRAASVAFLVRADVVRRTVLNVADELTGSHTPRASAAPVAIPGACV